MTAINARPDQAAIARALSLLVHASRVSPPIRQAVATVEAALNADAAAEPQFVLDRTENPHPRMLAGALRARHESITGGRSAYFYWRGYRAAMADATGETAEDIERWMDRDTPPPPNPTPVSDPRRRA